MTKEQINKMIADAEILHHDLIEFTKTMKEHSPHLEYKDLKTIYFLMRISKNEKEIKELKQRLSKPLTVASKTYLPQSCKLCGQGLDKCICRTPMI